MTEREIESRIREIAAREKKEHEAEVKLIAALDALGLEAKHMDTTVDGFPDTIILGPRIILVEMKYVESFYEKIYSVTQPTQPVFMHRTRSRGLKDIYICAVSSGGAEWKIFSPENILELSMIGATMDELKTLAVMPSVEHAAEYLASLARS